MNTKPSLIDLGSSIKNSSLSSPIGHLHAVSISDNSIAHSNSTFFFSFYPFFYRRRWR